MRHTLFIVIGLTISTPTFAQSGPELWLTRWSTDEAHVEMGADVMLMGDADTDSGADFDLTIYKSEGRARFEPADKNTPQFGYDLVYLDIDTSDMRIPNRLTDQSFSVGMHVGEWDGWEVAIVAGAGFAGDLPYADGDGYYGLGSIIAVKQVDERASWQLMLGYNGNRTIFPDLPLPGIDYIVKVNDRLTYSVGLPRSAIYWRAYEWLYLSAEYTFPTTVNAWATWLIAPEWRVYGGFNNSLYAFHPNVNPDNRRIFFNQRRLETGVKWLPCEWFDATVGGGYAFSQEFTTGWDLRDTNADVEIDDSLYMRFAINVGF